MNAKKAFDTVPVFVVLAICDCTRVKTTEVSYRHRDQITSDELIRFGERETITTADGVNHELRPACISRCGTSTNKRILIRY